MSTLTQKNNIEPSSPASGSTVIYVDSTSKKLSTKDDAGAVVEYSNNDRDDVLPVGGTTGQVLSKIDATNYNTEWLTLDSAETLEGFLGAENFTTTLDTLQDTGISLALGANESWQFEFNLQNGCSGTGGIKYAISLPAGATIRAVIQSITSGNTAYTSQLISSAAETAINVNTVNSQGGWARIVGRIDTSATAGNANLQVRVNTAGQTATVYKESHYKATNLT